MRVLEEGGTWYGKKPDRVSTRYCEEALDLPKN
jgi:hypothetical protein